MVTSCQVLAILVLCSCVINIIGLLYGVPALYQWSMSFPEEGISMPAAVSIAMLSIAILIMCNNRQ